MLVDYCKLAYFPSPLVVGEGGAERSSATGEGSGVRVRGTPSSALRFARAPSPTRGEGKGCASAQLILERFKLGNRAEPNHTLAFPPFRGHELPNLRHPLLINLPDRPKQRLGRGHFCQARRRMLDAAARPFLLSLGSEPEVHP